MTVSDRHIAAELDAGWCAQEPDLLGLRDWGEEFVVYCGARASTHVISALAGILLLALIDVRRSMTLRQLCAASIEDFVIDQPALKAIEAVQSSLIELENYGLVFRARH